jgi:nitrate/TMAO reductase-like tetraheme cytochrome c subunit
MSRVRFGSGRIARVICFVVAGTSSQLTACKDDAAEETTYTREKLMDPLTCKKCHEDYYNEWSGSMHAYASVDPVFRAMNARGQRETNKELGPFCVKCHAPLAVQEKATTDGTNIADVPEKLQGVTCYFCHQVNNVHGENNAALDLANDTTMRGGYDNPTKNEAHRSEYSPLHDGKDLESSKLCGSCHDISVPAHFSGATEDVALERTHQEWQSSIFATGRGPRSCASCHLPRIEQLGGIAIADAPGVGNRPARHPHDVPGVDVALTDFPNKETQKASVLALLSTSLRVQVCFNPTAGMTVRLENVAIGHNMPSGASQDRRLWVEVHVYDNKPGEPEHETLTRGVVPPGTAVTDLLQTEPDLMLFRDEALDKEGNPAHMFWNIASIKPQPSIATAGTAGTIGVPVTIKATDPLYHANHDVRVMSYNTPFGSQHAPVTIHMQPMGLDVLNDLVESGDLDAAIRDAMPTFDFLPNEGVAATVDWTLANSTKGDYGYDCMETAPR